MSDFWHRLKQRKLVQWAVAYIAAAFALLQGIDIVAQQFGWPENVQRGITLALVLGFFVTLVLAWYHGERGAQKVSGVELIILAAVLAVGGGFLWRYAQTSPPVTSASVATSTPAKPASEKPTAEPTSIAVLPFADMSQAHDQEYFSDGLSEELLNQLAQIPQLRVIARTSSFAFKGKEVGISEIAKALNVAHVLEGSVRKSGDTLRITAQLIRTSDSSHLWSRTYDRKLTDVFKVQDEIAAAVVDALKLKLLSKQPSANPYRSSNTEAHLQYLLGKEFYNRDTSDQLPRAADAFRRAIAMDPTYGAPRAGLASVEYLLADNAGDPASKQHALDIANQAVTAAPQFADAYAARGTTRLSFFRDWDGARDDFEKALQLNAASSVAQIGYYRLLMALGRLSDAEATARKATVVDPLSVYAWTALGRTLYALGRYDDANKALLRAREISPDSNYVGFALGMNALMWGRPQAALESFQSSDRVYRRVGIAMAQHALGDAQASQQALDKAITNDGDAGAYQIAEAYAWRGETDKAFEWLDIALAHDDGGLTFLKSDPVLDRLAGDPRYAALLKKLGLPE